LPDVAAAYQDWTAQQNKIIAEENGRLLADSCKMMNAMLRICTRNIAAT
jgi:hypothetical protein